MMHRRARLQPISGTPDAETTAVQDVRINHRRADVGVAEELLHLADVVAVFQQVRGERAAERVAARTFRESGLADRGRDRSLDRTLVEVEPRRLMGTRISAEARCGKNAGSVVCLSLRSFPWRTAICDRSHIDVLQHGAPVPR